MSERTQTAPLTLLNHHMALTPAYGYIRLLADCQTVLLQLQGGPEAACMLAGQIGRQDRCEHPQIREADGVAGKL